MKKVQIRLYKYNPTDDRVKMGMVDEDEWYWGDCWIKPDKISALHEFNEDSGSCVIVVDGTSFVVKLTPAEVLKLMGV